jgi:ABC-type bacteriocin/lantibiotic exporter with double-glycine peptidase domain
MRELLASGAAAIGTARRVLRHITRESPVFLALAAGTAAVQSALLIPIAIVIRYDFDHAIPHHHVAAMILSGVLIAILYGTAALSGLLSRVTAIRISSRTTRHLRVDLLAKLYALPQRWHDRQRAGLLHSLLVQDTERAAAMLSTVASVVCPAAIVGAVLIVVAAIVDPLLFATMFVVAVPLTLAGGLLRRRTRRRASEWADSASRFSAQSQLQLRAMATTKVMAGEAEELQRATDTTTELERSERAIGASVAAAQGLDAAVAAIAGSAVLIVGGIAISQRAMTLGGLLSFYALLALLVRQLSALGWQTHDVVVGLQSLARADQLLAEETEDWYAGGRKRLRFQGAISCLGASFDHGETPVLRDITFTISPSEHVALIGPNGAGKSTLVSLVLGLYQPLLGRLEADGVAYDQLELRELRRQIGVVLQDPVLLPGTIRDNIAYCRPEAPDETVWTAAHVATAAEFIADLPAGYATNLGDEGMGLSAGQRQRVAIARALFGSPALLILDEPTTYLDRKTITTLLGRLLALPQAPTVLLVTHDSEVAAHADRVIEIRDGRIVSDLCVKPEFPQATAQRR